ncbi:MAG: hypothetical protein K0Q74_1398 [Gammaproteobacteria bacterium]|nr:hypothetical protein [Gammaproteobacteria bacterium]
MALGLFSKKRLFFYRYPTLLIESNFSWFSEFLQDLRERRLKAIEVRYHTKALDQINVLNYDQEMKAQGMNKITKIGMAFSGKNIAMIKPGG